MSSVADEKSLKFRQQGRSLEEFKNTIKHSTICEGIFGDAMHVQFNALGMICDVLDIGVDNTGEFINGKLLHHNPDKLYVFKTPNFLTNGKLEARIEIKTIPEGSIYWTIKVFALKRAVREQSLVVIALLGKFYVIFPEASRQMLKLPHRIYSNFADDQLAIRIENEVGKVQVSELISQGHIKEFDWCPEAKVVIENNRETLITRKKGEY